MNDKIKVEYLFNKVLNFSMQQNHVPIVENLNITNNCEEKIGNIKIEIISNPEFIYKYEQNIEFIDACGSFNLNNLDIKISPEFLYMLNEKIIGNLNIKIMQGEEVLYDAVEEISVLPYNHWIGSTIAPELLTSYSFPNDDSVTYILKIADGILKNMDEGLSFCGYMSNNINNVKKQVAAIYSAVRSLEISYCISPASFESFGQKIRFPKEILEGKLANCLDITMLFISLFESIGLNPIILIYKGHANIACWLENKNFPEIIQDDAGLITSKMKNGINEIVCFESTAVCKENNAGFEDASRNAYEMLYRESEFEFAIDVKRARMSGVMPLPIISKKEDGTLDFNNVKLINLESSNDDLIELIKSEEISEKNYVLNKQEIWERNLLDLSLKNSLLNFRVNKNSVQLITNNLSDLEDALSTGREFKLLSVPKEFLVNFDEQLIGTISNKNEAAEMLIKSEFDNNRIRTFIDENLLNKNLTMFYRRVKTSLEENGVNTMYLAIGLLRWYESNVSEKARYAPLILVPIEIIRKSASQGYIIRAREEETQINVTLLELLKRGFGFNVSSLMELPRDENGVDINRVFYIVSKLIEEQKRWRIEEKAFIGIFSFSHFIMWNDIKNRADDLKQNKIVASLIEGKRTWQEEEMIDNKDLDEAIKSNDLAIPLSVDSSQLAAIYEANRGKSFVLHGPPGTGKSQTITNIIANALYHDKSVLFIAEKMEALSVVQRRLANIGLDEFCLELHSNKARKRDVLNQLEKVLELGNLDTGEEYEKYSENIENLKSELNELVSEIHKPRKVGKSLYDIISAYEKYKDFSSELLFTKSQIETLDKDTLDTWNEKINSLRVVMKECKEIHGNALIDFRKLDYNLSIRDELKSYLEKYENVLNDIKKTLYESVELVNIDEQNFNQNIAAKNLLNTLLNSEKINSNLLYVENSDEVSKELYDIFEKGSEAYEIKEKLSKIFSEDILNINVSEKIGDLNEAENSWIIAKAIGVSKLNGFFKRFIIDKNKYDLKEIRTYLNMILLYQKDKEFLEEKEQKVSVLTNGIYNGINTNWQIFKKVIDDFVSIRNEVTNINYNEKDLLDYILNNIFENLEAFKTSKKANVEELNKSFKAKEDIEKWFLEKFEIDFNSLNCNCRYFEFMNKKILGWRDNIDGLKNWGLYLELEKEFENIGLSDVINNIKQGNINSENIIPIFNKCLNKSLANYYIESDPKLSKFNSVFIEEKLNKYKQFMLDYETLTKNEIISRLSKRIPKGNDNVTNGSEIGILKKAIKSGGRNLSIRKLFEEIPNLLRKLCPCMLMSPISVAQYIDPAYAKFDLVIFDEASQVPTSEAVGAIARGENAIIVGDPKQLPPTTFFTTNTTSEDMETDNEDLESILDDCLAISMPEKHLLWHYRSRHESLIRFSNVQFYDNKLYTFPANDELAKSVKFVSVDGFYDRGRSKQNLAEANEVIKEIIRRLSDDELRKKSIGIVTFNVIQQNLIQDLLDEEFVKNPKLEEINLNSEEPIFIKNLESVQGDERDVILFSIGYGPDRYGKVSLNFGPINRDKGWRRLNVAVSRAREEMIVFSSLQPEQIDTSKNKSEGVANLKNFLLYAKTGIMATSNENYVEKEDGVEKQIAKALESKGYTVRTNVGASKYRLDIGVVNPANSDEYILGIMCDGYNYADANTCRDRNILHESVLRNLGWNIHRVWAIDWIDNPEKEILKIVEILEKLKAGDLQEETIESKIEMIDKSKRQELVSDKAESNYYENAYLGPNQENSLDEFYSVSNNSLIKGQILIILNKEAPISKKALYKKITNHWGITKLGSKIEKRLDEILAYTKVKTTVSKYNIFLWNELLNPDEYDIYRVNKDGDNRRDFGDICPQEIANAIREILQMQVGINVQDLYKEVAKVFGYTRVNETIESIVNEGIELAVQKEFIDMQDNRVILK